MPLSLLSLRHIIVGTLSVGVIVVGGLAAGLYADTAARDRAHELVAEARSDTGQRSTRRMAALSERRGDRSALFPSERTHMALAAVSWELARVKRDFDDDTRVNIERHLRQSIELSPLRPNAWVDLAWIRAVFGLRGEETVQIYTHALKLGAAEPDLRRKIARTGALLFESLGVAERARWRPAFVRVARERSEWVASWIDSMGLQGVRLLVELGNDDRTRRRILEEVEALQQRALESGAER